MKARLFLLAASLLLSVGSKAQNWTDEYVSGGVYRIDNVAKSGECLAAHGFGKTVCTETNTNDDSQLWQLTLNNAGTGFYMRNLNNGAYLTSSNGVSQVWSVLATTTPDNSSAIIIENQGSNKKFRAVNGNNLYGYGYAHSDAAGAVVCWEATNTNSQWQFTLIESISTREAAEKIAEAQALWHTDTDELQNHLDALFADKSCTTLRSAYSSASDAELAADRHYAALPEVLQTMVRKVRDNNWAETYSSGTTWDSDHAKKFRVQLYEPFSRGWEGSAMMNVQAYTNMNNPSGLIADNKDNLYIMVEDEVPEGATLAIGSAPGDGLYNDFNGQYTLHQGLNVIPIWDNHALQYIYYTVDTWDVDKKQRKYRLDDFSPIKIHIEGGQVNGHFNPIGDALYTPDTNDDWKYYRTRARHNMFDLIGEHIILHFYIHNPLEGGYDLIDEFNESARDYDIAEIVRYWDDIVFYQKMLMGVLSDDDIRSDRAKRIGYSNPTYETLYEPLTGDDVCPADYHHYVNSRMMGLSINTSYMNGGAWRAAYNAVTMNDILTGIMLRPGNLWGPAHEHGHINQQPLKIAGTTEESNNVFSNVAVYYRGINTARTDVPSKQRDVFNQGKTFLQNDTWGTTRMFYQLWLYYHACGNNRKFYPRLFELLRQNPLEKRGGGSHLQSRYDLLHFAKMCCVAAKEDLTDFFTTWGFFVVQDDFFIDDYSQYHSYLSQEDIDAVKAEIAAYGYPKNTSIIFIDDRPGSTRTSWDSDMAIEKAGTMGGLNDFRNGSSASGNYSFTLEGNTLTVSGGEGGVGFLLYDADGNLIGFSNDPTFTLTDEAAMAVATGQCTVQTVNTDSSAEPVIDIVASGNATQKRAELNKLIAAVQTFLTNQVDRTARTVGRIAPSYATELDNKLNSLTVKIAQGALADEDLTAEYRALAQAYYGLICNDDAYIDFTPGKAYILTNAAYTNRMLSCNGTKLTSVVNGSPTALENHWVLESATDDGKNVFFFRNKKYDTYAGSSDTKSQSIPMTSTAESYTLEPFARDVYSPWPTAHSQSVSIHIDGSGSVVTWYTTEPHSQWVFSLAYTDEDIENSHNELNELIAMTNDLIGTVGTISESEDMSEITLDPALLYSNAYYTGNGNDKFTSFSVLTDNNVNTYFHSDYSGDDTTDGLDHYIRITIPDATDLADYDFLKINYTTRNSTAHWSPRAFSIDESSDLKNWYAALAENSDLPNGSSLSYTTKSFMIPDGTRHVRFMVTDTEGQAGGHDYFALSELGLSGGTFVATPDYETYPHVTTDLMLAAKRRAVASNFIAESPNSLPEDYMGSYALLKPAYDALLAAKNDTSDPAGIIIEISSVATSDVIYDLQGRRISTPRRGLYIINGNKTIVK